MDNKLMIKEKKRLDSYSTFYEKGDLYDNMIIDREEELIKKYCENTTNCIEVGCGNGYSTAKLISLFKEYDVVEPVPKNIELLKLKDIGDKIKFYNCLFEEFESNKKYKNILLLNILEHVDDPVQMLIKCKNILSDDGQIYISVPNCMSLNRRAGYIMGLLDQFDNFAPKDIEVGHRRLYYADLLKNHCNQAGLNIRVLKGIYLKPLAEKQMEDLGTDIIKAFYKLGEDIPEYCSTLFAIVCKNFLK